MGNGIYPSGSIANLDIPAWARGALYKPIVIRSGAMAVILPIGGPIWVDEIVVVLEEVATDGSVVMYRVWGRMGETLMMKYALDIISE